MENPPSPDSTYFSPEDDLIGINTEQFQTVSTSIILQNQVISPIVVNQTVESLTENSTKTKQQQQSTTASGGAAGGGVGKRKSSSTPAKSYICPICNKSLARKDKLTIHVRIHTGERPYSCDICNKTFSRRDKLTNHIKKQKHSSSPTMVPQTSTPPLTKKILTEEIVQKSLSNSSQMSLDNGHSDPFIILTESNEVSQSTIDELTK